MDWLTDPQIWASLLTLTALEIVLGIDNLVFIAILVGRLPEGRQNRARQMGLSLALITRARRQSARGKAEGPRCRCLGSHSRLLRAQALALSE
jgi:hypothetical protein